MALTTTDSSNKEQVREQPAWRLPSPYQAMSLAAAAAFSPAMVWAGNFAEAGRPTGLILWALAVWLFGLVVWISLVRIGLDPGGVTYSLFWFLLAATLLGLVVFPAGTGAVGVIAILGAIAYLSYRVRDVGAYRYVTQWSIVMLALLPVGLYVSSRWLVPETSIHEPEPMVVSSAQSTPDVVLLIFDGHSSYAYLGDVFDPAAHQMQDDLEAHGMSFVDSASSNYTQTGLSVTSLMQMDYPLLEGERVEKPDWNVLLSKIQGDNRLVNSLHELGYTVTVVESGWSGASCGPAIDVCVDGPVNTQLVHRLFRRSVLSVFGVSPRQGFGDGTLKTIAWLDTNLGEVLDNGRPDFVMAHFMLPHPPYLIDGNCDYHEIDDAGRLAVGLPNMSESELELRRAEYVEVIQCAANVMGRAADQVGDSNVLITVGDHGPDSFGQMRLPAGNWNQDFITERFHILLGYSGACDIGATSLINVGRYLLACIQGTEPEPIEERFFISMPTPGAPPNTSEPLVEITSTD